MNKEKNPKTQNQLHYETISPATKLLEKRRKMYEVHEAFENQKQEYKKDQQKFKNVQEDIRKRDIEIQMQLVDFCQYLTQNQAKRRKVTEKIQAQKLLYDQKVAQIQNLEKQCEDLLKHQKKFQKKVVALRKYEEYLQKVQSHYSDQYPEMSEILKRQKTLKNYNDKYITDRQQTEKKYEELKVQALTFEKEINQSILQLNNQIKQLSRKLEDKINQKNQLETDVQNTNELASKKNLDLGKILMAIQNLHFRCTEANLKIKHNFQQFKNQQKNEVKKINKTTLQKKKETKDKIKSTEQQENYQTKSKIAGQRLKSIFSYMKDFKSILDDYKKWNQQNPQKK